MTDPAHPATVHNGSDTTAAPEHGGAPADRAETSRRDAAVLDEPEHLALSAGSGSLPG